MAQGTIRKRPDRGNRWEVRVDLGRDGDGRRRQRGKIVETYREAQKLLKEWQREIDQGTAVDASDLTMQDLLEMWLHDYARPTVRPLTYVGYESTILCHLMPAFGDMKAQRVTARDIQSFYATQKASGMGDRVLMLCHLRLRQVFAYARRVDLVARNPTDQVTVPRGHRSRQIRVWTPEEARHFLDASASSPYYPLWPTLLATGMRRGEILGLRWQDFDATIGTLRVVQTVVPIGARTMISPPKSRAALRTVSIPRPLVALLNEHRTRQTERRASCVKWQDFDLLFPAANGAPIGPRNLQRDFARILVSAGVPSLTIHGLRHIHVSHLLATGVPIRAVSQRVGHAQTSITLDIYSHVLPDDTARIADHVGRLFFDPPE